MKNDFINRLYKYGKKIIIPIASLVLLYLVISLYFINHYFFNTVINGADVSLKAHTKTDSIVKSYIDNYELILTERNGKKERLSGHDIGIIYNSRPFITGIKRMQKPYVWISSLFKDRKYYVEGIISYDNANLNKMADSLDCLRHDIIEPKNVSFRYTNGSYEVIEAVFGNKVDRIRLIKMIAIYLLQGKTELNLDTEACYKVPKYTLNSEKTLQTRDILDRYVSSKITYNFGNKKEILDGAIISKWLIVNDNLDVAISKKAAADYILQLGTKYNTVGTIRKFITSTGKTVEVKGGLYGWRINQKAEVKALLEHISHCEIVDKEPVYSQTALSHNENDIGDTYVEINITRQHLWYYKNGKLLVHGSIVTGNPNRGNSTVIGTYMINYKEKKSSLTGANYDVKVDYWMPFYGNIGIHDAKWRSAFGGEIYKKNGTHGCVNVPYHIAKTIFENIEEGIPVICYKEKL